MDSENIIENSCFLLFSSLFIEFLFITLIYVLMIDDLRGIKSYSSILLNILSQIGLSRKKFKFFKFNHFPSFQKYKSVDDL